MTRRFEDLGVLEQVRFVDAVERTSPLVDRHLARAGTDWVTERRRTEVACLLSHLKALETLLDESEEQRGPAIVCEDDILFHRDWPERLEGVLGNLPEDAPLCSLGYQVMSWDGFSWGGLDPARRNVMAMNPVQLWGAHAYLISRAHAAEALEHYEQVISKPDLFSEFIVKWPGAYIAFPPLVVEDGTPSTIRTEREMQVQRMVHHGWGVDNYRSDDPGDHRLVRRLDTSQTICLCMIVRNEATVIHRLAKSLEGLIDAWVICDTGSNDGTPQVVAESFGHLPGELHHDEWKDYGTNRSLLLERARGKADYLLILDADQTVQVRRQIPTLRADAYALLVDEPAAHWVPRLVRGDLPWRYVGAAHEYLACDQPYGTELLHDLVVRHHADGGNRDDKYARELALLEADHALDPDNPRTVFYLAQTHREMGHEERALELYARRVELGGWEEEVFYAMFCHAELTSRRDWDTGMALLLKAFGYRPTRAEPLYALARGLRRRNQHRLAALFAAWGTQIPFPEDVLFVHRAPYEWALAYEWAIASHRLGDYKGALEEYDRLFARGTLPPEITSVVFDCRGHCRVALGLEEPRDSSPLEAFWVPRLPSLADRAEVGQLQLALEDGWTEAFPAIIDTEEGFTVLLGAVRPAGEDLGDDEEPIHLRVRLDRDLAVESATVLDGTLSPKGTVLRRDSVRLLRLGVDVFALAEVSDDGGPATVATRLVDARFEEPTRLLPTDPASPVVGWTPVSRGDELFVLTGLGSALAARCDLRTGKVAAASGERGLGDLSGELPASPGLPVGNGTLLVTRSLETGLDEHRFVLLDPDSRVVSLSPRFCFEQPVGERCIGLCRKDDVIVLSFGRVDGGAFLVRLPYEDVVGLLQPPQRP
jgi:glycosyltransferase involved in cell wall biosynthesis